MRVVLQRVKWASVCVEGECIGEIEAGLLVLLGIAQGDTPQTASALAKKIAELRIFSDARGKMNDSLLQNEGGALVVSQFTLFADCNQGRRPFFGGAEAPEKAAPLCDAFAAALKDIGVKRVETGRFGADMQVELCNDGPVTILLDA
jgi:D-aminoacyl-tRNA deacylase